MLAYMLPNSVGQSMSNDMTFGVGKMSADTQNDSFGYKK